MSDADLDFVQDEINDARAEREYLRKRARSCLKCGGSFDEVDEEPEDYGRACYECWVLDKVQCPSCRGDGQLRGPERGMPYYDCGYCTGRGVVTEGEAADWPLEP